MFGRGALLLDHLDRQFHPDRFPISAGRPNNHVERLAGKDQIGIRFDGDRKFEVCQHDMIPNAGVLTHNRSAKMQLMSGLHQRRIENDLQFPLVICLFRITSTIWQIVLNPRVLHGLTVVVLCRKGGFNLFAAEINIAWKIERQLHLFELKSCNLKLPDKCVFRTLRVVWRDLNAIFADGGVRIKLHLGIESTEL